MNLSLLVALIFGVSAGLANAQTDSPATGSLLSSNQQSLDQDLAIKALDLQLAPVKSAQDLQAYLARMPNASALQQLSAGGRKRFLDSLVFSERGLASFDYRDLRVDLSASQIYRLLQLFGVQRSVAAIPGLRIGNATDVAVGPALSDSPKVDCGDYACKSHATCSTSTGSLCIGSNC